MIEMAFVCHMNETLLRFLQSYLREAKSGVCHRLALRGLLLQTRSLNATSLRTFCRANATLDFVSGLVTSLVPKNLCTVSVKVRSRDSSVVWRWVIGGSSPGRGWEFFFSSLRPDRLWSPPSLVSNGYQGLFPLGGGNLSGREPDHSPPSAEDKECVEP
jgi:hypothetical protein